MQLTYTDKDICLLIRCFMKVTKIVYQYSRTFTTRYTYNRITSFLLHIQITWYQGLHTAIIIDMQSIFVSLFTYSTNSHRKQLAFLQYVLILSSLIEGLVCVFFNSTSRWLRSALWLARTEIVTTVEEPHLAWMDWLDRSDITAAASETALALYSTQWLMILMWRFTC